MTNFERQIHDIILIHVARTWERIRVTRPHQEMPADNIASTDIIEQIAYEIFKLPLVQEFLEERDGCIWDRFGDGNSDVYIERCAREIIESDYL